MLKRLGSRILSGFAAIAMLLSVPAGELSAFAQGDPSAPKAHTVPVFDIDVRSGAEYYETYQPDIGDPLEGGVYVWKADKPTEGHKFVYNIKLSVSGEGATDIKPDDMSEGDFQRCKEAVAEEGFIRITVPAHIFKLRGQDAPGIADSAGVYPDDIEMPVPRKDEVPFKIVDGKKVYSTDHDFVYEYDADTDSYVIYNIRPVSSGVVYELPIAYTLNNKTWDYQDLEPSEACHASVSIKSWPKNGSPDVVKYVEKESRSIPLYIDTHADLTGLSKRAEKALLSAEETESATGLTGLDPNYSYTVWSLTTDVSNVTQAYNLRMNDVPNALTGKDKNGRQYTIPGEVVAVKFGNGNYVPVGTDGYDLSPRLTASGKRTDYVLVKYPNASGDGHDGVDDIKNAPRTGTYKATNTADMTLIPADGKDNEQTKSTTASFGIELRDPSWHPVETSYTSTKSGLYNSGKSKVTGPSNVTSYEMQNIIEGKSISGLKFLSEVTAHAYGMTVDNLNDLLEDIVILEDGSDIVTIQAGPSDYVFDKNDPAHYTVNHYDAGRVNVTESVVKDIPEQFAGLDTLDTVTMQRIFGLDAAENYFGQKNLDYVFTDDSLSLTDKFKDQQIEDYMLEEDDYRIDTVAFTYNVRNCKYMDHDDIGGEDMIFVESELNEDLSADPEDNRIYFYTSNDGYTDPVAYYDRAENKTYKLNDSIVRTVTPEALYFRPDAEVKGYQVRASNKYFFIQLNTTPSITLYPTEKVHGWMDGIASRTDTVAQGTAPKTGLKNTANWEVYNGDTRIYDKTISGTDYIAQIERKSKKSKVALGERTSFTGRDGNVYKSMNDPLHSQYQLAWRIDVSETASGIEDANGQIGTNVPVAQQSGVFYDLLPTNSDIIEGSVNVYVDLDGEVGVGAPQALAPSEFEVLPREDDHAGSGKKLLTIKVNAPCKKKYTVTYVTIHSHADIQDYGPIALNSMAYQTGNESIGNGYPDNGGDHAISMSEFMTDLDPDNNGAKRFIYAECTEDILALFPKSSGIFKKVSTASDPTYSKSAVVRGTTDSTGAPVGETYTYSIRMKNDSSTNASDIAILDSIENYRTPTGQTEPINYGIDRDRDWHGTVRRFDLSTVEEKIVKAGRPASDLKLMLYISDDVDTDVVDLSAEAYSDPDDRQYLLRKILGLDTSESGAQLTPEEKAEYDALALKWVVVPDWRNLPGDDLEKVTAFIVYTGEQFMLPKDDSISFKVSMQAPDYVNYDEEALKPEEGKYLLKPTTYNNVYRSFRTSPAGAAGENVNKIYFYTHYDYTQVKYTTVGTLKFIKTDRVSGEPIPGVKFSLSGISDFGTAYDETLISDTAGYVTFFNLERGTYTLTESIADPDHIVDTEPKTVKVDMVGGVTIVTMDGAPMPTVQNGDYDFPNERRYHGDLVFRKADSLSDKGAGGAVFRLQGLSDHNTEYDLTAESAPDGTVIFSDIEKGTYTLTEIQSPAGYLPPSENVYNVTSVGEQTLIFKISGENARTVDGDITIGNEPMGTMSLQKQDSITGDFLDDAKFVLTATGDAADKLDRFDAYIRELNPGLTDAEYEAITGWKKTGGVWTQTIDNSNSAVEGIYDFKNLPCGVYSLSEERAPAGYDPIDDLDVSVDYNGTAKKVVTSFTSGTEGKDYDYIAIIGDKDTTCSAAEAKYQRIYNNENFESPKTVFKSWVGNIKDSVKPPFFPSMHLSSDKPQGGGVKTVTIGTLLKEQIALHKSAFKGFERDDTIIDTENKFESEDSSFGEEGHFYFKWDASTGKMKWATDAAIVHMPQDCSGLFQGCTALQNTFSLEAFDFSRVTNMDNMFNGCTNLTEIKFPEELDTGNLTSMSGTFNGCTKLAALDLSKFNTSNVTKMDSLFKNCTAMTTTLDLRSFETGNVTTFESMFEGMKNVKNILLDHTKFTAAENVTTVAAMFKGCENLNGIDLRGFGNCTNLESMENWFYNGKRLTYIDLSNFSTTTTLRNIKGMFYYNGQALSGNPGTNTGTRVFGKGVWLFADDAAYNYDAVNWMRVNLYGIMYKNAAEDGNPGNPVFSLEHARMHFRVEYENPPHTTGSGTNLRTTGGYFNPAYVEGTTDYTPSNYSDVYRTWALSTYGSLPTNSTQNVSPNANALFAPLNSVPKAATRSTPGYTGFEVRETVDYEDDETFAVEKNLGKSSYSFEYTTDTAGTDNGDGTYTVPETLVLTVKTVVEKEGGGYQLEVRKYDYTAEPGLTATWSKVGEGDNLWRCDMKVNDAEDSFFCWEDKVNGYNSSNLKQEPLITEGSTDTPVITNSNTAVPVGKLELRKTVDDLITERFYEDRFWFKVTMKNPDNSPYNVLPFDGNGVAYFEIKPNVAADDEKNRTIIKGIPAGCKYTVEEVDEDGHPMPEGFTKLTAGEIPGTIDADTATVDNTSLAEIENELERCDLTVRKKVSLLRKNELGETRFSGSSDSTDPAVLADYDMKKWMNESFDLYFTFTNLEKEKEYTIEKNGVALENKLVGSKNTATTTIILSVKANDEIVIKGLPKSTAYTVTEVKAHNDDETTTYDVEYTQNSSTTAGSYEVPEKALEANDTLEFHNKKTTVKPDTVNISVKKEWYDENGNKVTVTEDSITTGGVTVPNSEYPSFLKVYLGRALKYEADGIVYYLDPDTAYSSCSLNENSIDEDGDWVYTFEDLPKSGTVMTDHGMQICEYVYYLREVLPIGFENINSAADLQNIGEDSYYVASLKENSTTEFAFTFKNKREPSYTLSVGKKVVGNMANMTQSFVFDITLLNPDGTPLRGTGLDIVFTDWTEEERGINAADGGYWRKRTYTIENGTVSISLPHGKKATFLSLPSEISYTIRERQEGSENYTVRSGVYTGQISEVDHDDLTVGRNVEGYLTANTDCLYINDCSVTLPTGVEIPAAAPVGAAIGCLIALAALYYVRSRRRDEAEEQ